MKYNPTKQATDVIFSCKKSSVSHLKLTFNGMDVSKVNDQKHLGFILDSHLYFGKYINEIIIIAKQNVGILKHLSEFLPVKTLGQMYKALVRPLLDYCNIIYHKPTHVNLPPLGVSLNSQMEKSRKNSKNTKHPMEFLVLGAVLVIQNSTKN